MRLLALLGLGAGAALTLQGCGGPGEITAVTTTTTTSTTTTKMRKPQHGATLDAHAIADLMWKNYQGFNPNDSTSPKGVYIRITTEWKVYCHRGCFQGDPDCRISGSILNHNMMLGDNYSVALDFGKPTGWYINQTAIDEKLGKCSFAWDGGSMGKYNFGCGCNGPSGKDSDCQNEKSPYRDLDPDTGYKSRLTDRSPLLKDCACVNKPESQWPTTQIHGAECFWKGPAWYKENGLVLDDTFSMLKWRDDHEKGQSGQFPDLRALNEVIIDGEELLEALDVDAAATVLAMVYKTDEPGARDIANAMSMQMAAEYRLASPVPLIGIDMKVDTRFKSPFVVEPVSIEVAI